MSKYKKQDKAQAVATSASALQMITDDGSPHDERLFACYCAMLASTDWRRDVRKQETIMQEVLKSARLALEVFDAKEES